MAQLPHQTIDVWSTMEPVAADESTAGDVGSVQNMRLMRLVVDIGNNRTIEIPLRGQLVVHNSGSGAAAEAAAGVDDGGAAAQAAADDDGGAAAEAAAGNDGGVVSEAAAGDVGGAVSQGAAGHVGGVVSQAAAGDDSSLSEKEHLHAKVANMMTVAALFAQTSFQAAMQPPTWIPTNWYHMFFPMESGGADVAPSTASPPALTRWQELSVWAYVASNTVTFATALSIMMVQLQLGRKFPLKFTIGTFQYLFVWLAVSSCVTYVIAFVYVWRVALLASGTMVAYGLFAYLAPLLTPVLSWSPGGILRRIAGRPSSQNGGRSGGG